MSRLLGVVAVLVLSGLIAVPSAHAGLLGGKLKILGGLDTALTNTLNQVTQPLATTVQETTAGVSQTLDQVLTPVVGDQLADQLNVLPPAGLDPITPVTDLLTGEQGLPATLQQITCPVVSEVAELLGPGLSEIGEGLTTLACNAGILEYKFFTRSPAQGGGFIERTHVATLGVPQLMDVNGDTLPDVAGTITLTGLNTVGLKIDRLLTAPAGLKASIEAVLRDPTGGALGREHIAIGYDALADRIPGGFQLDIPVDTILRPSPNFDIDLTQTDRGNRIALIGGLFDGTLTQRANPTELRLDYHASPDTASIDATIGSTIQADLTQNRVGRAELSGRITDGVRQDRFDADFKDLPGNVGLTLATGDGLDVTYHASARVADLDAVYESVTRIGATDQVDQKAVLRLDDVPTGLTAHQQGNGGSVQTTGGPLGLAEIGVANGEPRFLTGEPAYISLDEDEDVSSIAARIPGIERITFQADDQLISASAKIAATPLLARLKNPGSTLSARVEDLPAEFDLGVDLEAGTLSYDGKGSGIGRIAVDGDGTEPIIGRATKLRGTIEGIPALLQAQLTFEDGQGGIEVTSPDPIERIELFASNGPETLPAGSGQGVVFHDVPGGDFLLAARILDLKQIAFSDGDAGTQLRAVTRGGPFSLDVLTGDLDADGLVEDLPADTTLGVDLDGGTFTFRGKDAAGNAQGIDKLTLAARSLGGSFFNEADRVDALIEGIPAELDLTLTPDGDRMGVEASNAIGRIELIAANRDIVRATDLPAGGNQGVHFVDRGGEFVLGARVLQLKAISARIAGQAVELDAQTAGGLFVADVALEDLTAEARIDQLPAKAHVVADLEAGHVEFQGRNADDSPAGIGELRLDVDSDDALIGRADQVQARLLGIPSDLSLDFAQNGEAFDVEANDGIDSIELIAANRAPDASDLPAGGEQGAKYTDLSGGDFVIAARINELTKLRAETGQPLGLEVKTAGGPFGIRVATDDLSGVVRIENLPSHLEGTLDLDAGRLELDGHGQGVDLVTVDAQLAEAVFGRATHVAGRIEGIPSQLTIDLAQEGNGARVESNAPIGKIEIAAANRPVDLVADLPVNDEQGAKYTDLSGGDFVVGARVKQLQKIAATFGGDGGQISTKTEGGPFGVRVTTDDLNAHARIEDLPAELDASLDLGEGRIDIDGHGQGIDRVAFEADSADAIFGRATHAAGEILEIPSQLTLALAQEGNGARVEANAPIGSIELAAANRPVSLVGDLPVNDEQGVRYTDLDGGEFVIGARVRDLQKVAVTFDGTSAQLATKTEGGPFGVRVITDELNALGRIENLPAQLDADLDLGEGRIAIDGHGDGIGRLLFTASSTEALFAQARHLHADIRDIPASLTLDLAQTATGASLESNEPIGSIEIVADDAPITDAAALLPANDEQGVIYKDTTGDFVIAARVRELKKLVASLADDGQVTLQALTEGGPFGVEAITDDLRANARFEDLPADVDVSFSPASGRFEYHGKDGDGNGKGVDLVTVDVVGDGIFDRADRLSARIEDLAADVEFTIDPEGPTASVVTASPITKLEFLATDIPEGDPVPDLPADEQGAIFHDKAGQPFVLRARLLDLKEISFGIQETGIELTSKLRHTPFGVDLQTDALDADARIDKLPASTTLNVDLENGLVTFRGFEADGTTPAGVDDLRLTATSPEPLFGRATRVHAHIADVPSALDIQLSQENGEAGIEANDPIGLIEILASEGTSAFPAPLDNPANQGAVYHDRENEPFVLAARVMQLTKLQVGFTLQLGLEARTAGGPFHVDVDTESFGAQGNLLDLPANAKLNLDLETGTVRFEGTDANGDPQGIDELNLTGRIAEPILGGANRIKVHIVKLPSQVELGFSNEDGNARLTANEPVELVELQGWAEGDPEPDFPADQGVILHNKPGQPFKLAARIRQLEDVTIQFGEAVNLHTKTAGGLFTADIESETLNADATIDELPEEFDIDLDLENGQATFDGHGQAIDHLYVRIHNDEPVFLGATDFEADLKKVPAQVTLQLPEDAEGLTNGISLAASDPIDEINLRAHSPNRPYPEVPAGEAGAILDSTEGELGLAVRVYKLQEIVVGLDPLTLTAKMEGGRRFSVDAKLEITDEEDEGAEGEDEGEEPAEPAEPRLVEAKAVIDKLPSVVTVGLEDVVENDVPNGSKLTLTGSAPIDLVSLDIKGLELLEGADHVKAEIEKVPQALVVALPETGALAQISAQDGNNQPTDIGQLRLAASSGTANLPADTYNLANDTSTGDDILNFVNTADDVDIAARISGVKSLGLNLEPISLSASLKGGKKLTVDATTANKDDDGNPTGTNTELDAIIDALPATLNLALADGDANAGGTKLIWQGSSAISQIYIKAVGIELLEGANSIEADIRGVPQAFNVALPDTEQFPAQPLAALAITGSQELSGGPRINELRLAAGTGALPPQAGNDKFIYKAGTGLDVGVKLTNVKSLAMKLDPIALQIGQEDTLNGGTKPIDIDAQLPSDGGPAATVTGKLDKPSFRTLVTVTLPPPGSGQANRLRFENGTAAVPRTMGLITLNAQNLGSIPSANFSLTNIPRILDVCMATDGACRPADRLPTALSNYSSFGGSPSQNATAGGMNRPYAAQVSMDFNDFGTSGNSSNINSMVTLNANINLGSGDPVAISNLRFHRLALDLGQNGTFGAFTTTIPRLYLFIDSDNRPYVMNEIKYPPQISSFKAGTDGSPATANRRLVWLPGGKCGGAVVFGACVGITILDNRASGSHNCGGQRNLSIQAGFLGTVNVLDFPLVGQLIPVCS